MPYPKRPGEKPFDADKNPVKALVVRIERAAGDLNPFLMVLAAGLLLLNLTLYLGMAAANDSFTMGRPRQDISHYAQPEATSATFHEGGSVSAGN
jgi:hypothetical protein